MNMSVRKIFKINKGFTLAEVLITLVIVGVVAALTIPNIIYETKKHEYSARLKKFYSAMKQASLRSEVDNKGWSDWAIAESTSSRGLEVEQNFMNTYLLPYVSFVKKESNKIYFNDGSSLQCHKGDCMDFIFDVNGDKAPNQVGRDIFDFLYCKSQMQFVSYNAVTSRSAALSNCASNPYTCSTLVMIDGWEFKKDYPYRL